MSMLVHEVLAYKTLTLFQDSLFFWSLLSKKLELNLEASNLAASINYLKLCACVPMCLWYSCGSAVARGDQKRPPGVGVTGLCEPPCGC